MAHLAVRRFLSHVAHRSGQQARAAQLPDHDNFTAGSAVSHYGRLSMAVQKGTGHPPSAIWNRSGSMACSSQGQLRVFDIFSAAPSSHRSRLWNRPLAAPSASAKSGVDEPAVGRMDAVALAVWRCIDRNAGKTQHPSGYTTVQFCSSMISSLRHAASVAGGVGAAPRMRVSWHAHSSETTVRKCVRDRRATHIRGAGTNAPATESGMASDDIMSYQCATGR